MNTNISKAQRIKSIMSASSGNFVEWFDFYIYLFLASYFTDAFFKAEDEVGSLIKTYLAFAFGFFMRPIGSLIFSSLADRIGRKKTLVYSIILMAFGNFMIASLPSVYSIGILAPILLVVARMIQGISVGAEGGLVATYISEMSTKGNRGFFSSFQYVTLIMAQFVAIGCVYIAVLLIGDEAMREYGWRILFALAGIFALLSIFLRSSMHESARELHKDPINKDEKKGSLKTLWKYKKYAFLVFGLTSAGSMLYYNFTAYMKTFLEKTAGFDSSSVYTISLVTLFFGMVIQPFMGMIGDKIGVKKMLLSFSIIAFFGVFPIMYLIAWSGPNGVINSALAAIFFICLALVITGFYSSIAGIAKASLFPEHIRALGTGLPYAMAVAMFGGSVPSVALWFKSSNMEWAYFIYMMFFCFICFIVALNIPKKTELEKQND